jgi:hypothetical protein
MSYEVENGRMIKWIAGKPPVITHAASMILNWDFAQETITWVVSQSKTAEATASMLFLLSSPSNAFPHMAEGKFVATYSPYEEQATIIRSTISKMWTEGRYVKDEVGYDPKQSNQRGFVDELIQGEEKFRDTGLLPWPVLKGIVGPFFGVEPKPLLDYFRNDQNEMFMVVALYHDLGSQFGELNVDSDPKYIGWRKQNGFKDYPQ